MLKKSVSPREERSVFSAEARFGLKFALADKSQEEASVRGLHTPAIRDDKDPPKKFLHRIREMDQGYRCWSLLPWGFPAEACLACLHHPYCSRVYRVTCALEARRLLRCCAGRAEAIPQKVNQSTTKPAPPSRPPRAGARAAQESTPETQRRTTPTKMNPKTFQSWTEPLASDLALGLLCSKWKWIRADWAAWPFDM